jgi:hypothetical protein
VRQHESAAYGTAQQGAGLIRFLPFVTAPQRMADGRGVAYAAARWHPDAARPTFFAEYLRFSPEKAEKHLAQILLKERCQNIS